MPVYSHSQLATFEQCPQKYKFHYIDRIRKQGEQGAEAFTGSMVHKTLQKLYDDLKYEKLNSLDDLLGYFHDIWRRSWNSGIKMVREGLPEENYRDYGARCISNYYQRQAPFAESRTLATETRLAFALDADGRYQFQGYVDRLARRADGTYEIHDYKTGGRLPTQAEADEDRQLALYQYGVEQRWREVERVELIWHYVGLDATLVSTRAPAQIAELRRRTIELVGRIERATNFPAVKSRLCDWCEYRPECPLWSHVAAVGAMPPARMALDEGVRLADEFAAVKSEIDRLELQLAGLREKIVRFGRERGTRVLQGHGLRVSISEHEQSTLPSRSETARDELEAFVRSTGKWNEVSELSAGRLTEAVKSGGWPAPWIERLRAYIKTRRVAAIRLKRDHDHEPEKDS